MKVLVLGLGNPLLTDDRVGLLVSQELVRRFQCDPLWTPGPGAGGNSPTSATDLAKTFSRSFAGATVTVEIDEECCGGLRLMERMVGYDFVVLIDAVYPAAIPGRVRILGLSDLPTPRTAGTHDAPLSAALALGKLAGYALPAEQDVVVVGIEAEDVFTFGEQCTPAVAAAVPKAVEVVMGILNNVLGQRGEASSDQSALGRPNK